MKSERARVPGNLLKHRRRYFQTSQVTARFYSVELFSLAEMQKTVKQRHKWRITQLFLNGWRFELYAKPFGTLNVSYYSSKQAILKW